MPSSQAWHDSVRLVDMHYIAPEKAASYIILEGDEAAVIDHTRQAIPHIEAELAQHGLGFANVKYLIITHVHLDHAGGTGHLAALCPNAQVLAHPKAARHLINPERIVAGSRGIYGDEMFDQLYGEVLPIPEDKVTAVADGTELSWGERTLRFEHTLGHATHHMIIFDDKSQCVFAGDSLGSGRSGLLHPIKSWAQCVTAPPDFDPDAAKQVCQRIADSGVRHACIAHYGVYDNVPELARQVIASLDKAQAVIEEALKRGIEEPELTPWCIEQVGLAMDAQLREIGVADFEAERATLNGDQLLNGMGAAHLVRRRRASQTA